MRILLQGVVGAALFIFGLMALIGVSALFLGAIVYFGGHLAI